MNDQPTDDHTSELQRRLDELESTTRIRIARAELKAEAVRAGMVDLDGLKLLDAGSVTMNTAGEVENATELMSQLRKTKPWLFGAGSSSSASPAPPITPLKQKLATEMTHDEWQAARAELLKRR